MFAAIRIYERFFLVIIIKIYYDSVVILKLL